MTDTLTLQANLTTALRPRRFSEVTGYDKTLAQLQNLFESVQPRAILLHGDPGTGKTTLASIIARSVNCEHQPAFGEPCDACYEAPYQIFERNCAELTKKEDTEPILGKLHYHPMEGVRRVFIFDEMQQMSDAAQQMLLKPFESAPLFNLFIVCTTDPAKINKALKQRCETFRLLGMSKDATLKLASWAALRAGMTGDPDTMAGQLEPLVQILRDREITSPRAIVMAVERWLSGMEPGEAAIVEANCKLDVFALQTAVKKGDWPTCQALLEAVDPNTRDFEEVRRRLVGHFRNQLREANSIRRSAVFSEAIFEMTDRTWPVEYGQATALLFAILYRICCRIQAVIAGK